MTAAPPVAPMLRRDLAAWWASPPGRHLLQWERQRFDAAVANLFGYHALQLGLPELDALATNRMPHRWLALPEPLAAQPAPDTAPLPAALAASAGFERPVALITHAAALPFAAQSLDLVLLPHTLELSADPHAVLREVERVLVPEGRVVIAGLNPASLWGLRQCAGQWAERWGLTPPASDHLFVPETGDWIAPWRLRDWLRLLDFELEGVSFGCWRPAVRSARSLARFAWMDGLGQRWWPVFGAGYFMVAVKRSHGPKLVGAHWKAAPVPAGAPVSIANRARRAAANPKKDLESH